MKKRCAAVVHTPPWLPEHRCHFAAINDTNLCGTHLRWLAHKSETPEDKTRAIKSENDRLWRAIKAADAMRERILTTDDRMLALRAYDDARGRC